MSYLITPVSRNAKTGPIMVTTSPRGTCPSSCPLMRNGCYADAGPLAFIWAGLTSAAETGKAAPNGRGNLTVHPLAELVAAIKRLPKGALWRHNQAGDLVHKNGDVDGESLHRLAVANRGKRGFTYTHHDTLANVHNREHIRAAVDRGFTVNLSANSLTHADALAELNIAPVVVVLPRDAKPCKTPGGRHVAVCPATLSDNVTCATCGLCASASRAAIIGFPAHGSAAKKAEAVTKS